MRHPKLIIASIGVALAAADVGRAWRRRIGRISADAESATVPRLNAAQPGGQPSDEQSAAGGGTASRSTAA